MKMTMAQIRDAYQALNSLSRERMNQKAVCALKMIRNRLKPHAELYDEQVMPLVEKYGDGQAIMASAEARAELRELEAVEVDVGEPTPIKLSALWRRGDAPDSRVPIDVSEAELSALGPLLDWEMDEDEAKPQRPAAVA